MKSLVSALGFSLIKNHAFVDGNKRIAHAAMETMLVLNNYQILASTEEQEQIILDVATNILDRDDFTKWIHNHMVELNQT